MGSFLAERLRDDYLPVGLTFNAGRYSACGPERIYPVEEGFRGTHEYILSQHRRGTIWWLLLHCRRVIRSGRLRVSGISAPGRNA